jgi:hypothetical protein
MNFPSAAVGHQGKCSGCQQIVMIQPSSPSPAGGPAVPPALPSSASEMVAPSLPGAVVLAQDQRGSGGNAEFAMIPGGGSTSLIKTQRSAAEKKKMMIIFAAAGGGVVVVLGLTLLLVASLFFLYGGVDQSSPEALGRSVFEVVKSDDLEAFIAMIPDEELMDKFITSFSKMEMFTEKEAEEMEKKARLTDFSAEASEIRNKGIDRFNSLVKYRDWQDADIVTVVSAGSRRIGEVSMTEYTFVVFELETQLHVLLVRNSMQINENWYFNFDGAQITVGLLSEMSTTRARVLLDALERTKDSSRNRILREVPR